MLRKSLIALAGVVSIVSACAKENDPPPAAPAPYTPPAPTVAQPQPAVTAATPAPVATVPGGGSCWHDGDSRRICFAMHERRLVRPRTLQRSVPKVRVPLCRAGRLCSWRDLQHDDGPVSAGWRPGAIDANARSRSAVA